MKKLLDIMARLRDPQTGCPWDVEQTFGSIAPYTIEEAYEVADAIDRNNLPDLKDELGDLLLQVVFHARMAEEAGEFDFGDVVDAIAGKMIRRHPHVFGNETIGNAAEQHTAWEKLKKHEREVAGHADRSLLQGIGLALPALARAGKLGKRAAGAGFDWPDSVGAKAKIAEEMAELEAAEQAGDQDAIQAEFGDVLFSIVNLGRHLGIDAEESLRQANRKFERRFRHLEQLVDDADQDIESAGPAELESFWLRVKSAEQA
jgi:ATP diphosphatase